MSSASSLPHSLGLLTQANHNKNNKISRMNISAERHSIMVEIATFMYLDASSIDNFLDLV